MDVISYFANLLIYPLIYSFVCGFGWGGGGALVVFAGGWVGVWLWVWCACACVNLCVNQYVPVWIATKSPSWVHDTRRGAALSLWTTRGASMNFLGSLMCFPVWLNCRRCCKAALSQKLSLIVAY